MGPVQIEPGEGNDLSLTVGPDDPEGLDAIGVLEAEGDGQLDLRQIGSRGHDLTPLHDSIRLEFDPGAYAIDIGRAGIMKPDSNPAMPQLLVVSKKKRTIPRLGHDEIEIPIGIDVSIRCPTTHDRSDEVSSGFRWNDLEAGCLIRPLIPEQLPRLTILLARLDLADLLFEVSIGLEEIEPTIEVVVEEEQAKGEQWSSRGPDALEDGLVGEELPVADVEARHLIGEVADADPHQFIVAIVGGVDAHRSGRLTSIVVGDTELRPHLLEGAIAQISIEEIPGRIVGHDEIHPTVPIHIDGHDRQRFAHRDPRSRVDHMEA